MPASFNILFQKVREIIILLPLVPFSMPSKRNYEEAIRLFKDGLRVQPRNTHILQAWAVMESRRGHSRRAIELFERAIEIRPSDAGIYNAYATLSKDLGDVDGARRLYQLGTKANRFHLATYQAWGLMEASVRPGCRGGVVRAREVFQQGVWAAPRGKGVSKLWQSWAIMEANNYQVGDAEEAEERMAVPRKYFQYAVDAEQQAYPTGIIISWAKTEERFGFPNRARALFEEAVRMDETNRRLWSQYEQFEGRQKQFAKQQMISQR